VGILLLATFSARSQSPAAGASSPAVEFWQWFESHSTEFADDLRYTKEPSDERQKKMEAIVHDVSTHLKTVHPNFSAFFESTPETRVLIVTVAGNKRFFHDVDRFVAEAPPITGWKFQALKAPRDFHGSEIRTGTVSFWLKDVLYTRKANPDGSFDFTVFLDRDISANAEGYRRLFWSLVEDGLGERLAATAINEVKVASRGTAPIPDSHAFPEIYKDIVSARKQ